MLSSADIKTELLHMEEDDQPPSGGVDPLEQPSSSRLGPVQEVPEDLSLKREATLGGAGAASSSPSSPPHHHQQLLHHSTTGFKTNISRSSSSPSSEGELIIRT
jgi:hypothetical protein